MAIISSCFVFTQVWLSLACLQRKNYNDSAHCMWRHKLLPQKRIQETIYSDIFTSWLRPQGLGLNSKVKVISFSIFIGAFWNYTKFYHQSPFIIVGFIAFYCMMKKSWSIFKNSSGLSFRQQNEESVILESRLCENSSFPVTVDVFKWFFFFKRVNMWIEVMDNGIRQVGNSHIV